MASESNEPTRWKHHSSPSDEDSNEPENPSKRRKHRHHRHHRHHHRHRHHSRSSKKEDKVEDATEPRVEVEEKRNDDNEDVDVAPDGAASGEAAPGSILGIDYDDMEEGEIVEDDEAADALQKRNPDSCFPPGESIQEEDGKSGRVGELRMSSKDAKVLAREENRDSHLERPSTVGPVANGEVVHEYLKDDFPHEECSQRNEEYHVESVARDKRMEMLAEDGRKKHRGLSSSPSQDTHHGRARSGSSLKSPDWSRGRSRSRSVFREGSLPDTPKAHDDGHHSKRMHRGDSDDEQMIELSRDYRHATKDLPRDKEREHSTYSRHSRADRHHSRETWDRDRNRSWDLDRDRTREKDRDRARAQEREG